MMSLWFKNLCIALVIGLWCVTSVQTAYAKSDEVYTSWRNNMAVGGYDIVSFYQGSPIKGDVKLMTKWRGADWHFANQSNLDNFLIDPERYVPAYGGYCAWAIAQNKLAKGSPKYWTLRDGRLYLNFNEKVRTRWLKDPDGFITDANTNWPAILE